VKLGPPARIVAAGCDGRRAGLFCNLARFYCNPTASKRSESPRTFARDKHCNEILQLGYRLQDRFWTKFC